MNDFINNVAEILEVDSVVLKPDTKFREAVDVFDSMMGFSLICLVSEEFEVDLAVKDFLECKTINDLYLSGQKK